MKFRIRFRLLLFLWGLFFVALLLPSVYYGRYLKDEILSETQARTGREILLLSDILSRQQLGDEGQLNDFLVTAAKRLQVRLTYVAEGGKVIADSDVPFQDIGGLENHAGRPEISDAHDKPFGTSIRYSGTLRVDLLYVARAVEPSGNLPGGVLRTAIPLSGVFYGLDKAGQVQYSIILVGFITFAVISCWLIVHTGRSVSLLSAAAESIGKGRLKIPPRFHPGHEFYPLARTIRETADRVDSYIGTITRQKVQLEGILEGIEEGILLLNSDGKIESANRAAHTMFPGIFEFSGRTPLEVMWSTEIREAFRNVIAGEASSYKGVAKIGPDRVYDVYVVRIGQSRGNHGAIVVLHDISDLKKLEQIRRDFVANASHELRTPLTSIKGYAEILLSDDGDLETRKSYLEIIARKTEHIIEIVNDLLQLARVEEFSNSSEIRPVNAEEALLEAWRSCVPSVAEKRIELRNGLQSSGLMVWADFEQLVQLFRNLLENAVKFSPAGAVIAVGASSEGGRATFAVSDHGPGIPKQDRQRIFERFYRVDKSRGKAGGTGLGLAICKHIIRNHGGNIWVESPAGNGAAGSTFFFTLRQYA
ncbi:MAG: PAS domain-containing protein [Desulfobacteraceae bacterium]|nr:PAS domain-containing protein [Desulfobacteraceae bacterium]